MVETLTADNAAEYFALASMFGNFYLLEAAMDALQNNFAEAMLTHGWRKWIQNSPAVLNGFLKVMAKSTQNTCCDDPGSLDEQSTDANL